MSVLALLPLSIFAHSGGTDSNGCHSGSEAYHCHNNKSNSPSISIGGWDVNAGYQYQIFESKLIPFLGLSYGKSEHELNSTAGWNLGMKHEDGWYASFVSTSKSVQLGYGFFHVAANQDYLGLGLRVPFGYSRSSGQSAGYYSGTMLFSSSD